MQSDDKLPELPKDITYLASRLGFHRTTMRDFILMKNLPKYSVGRRSLYMLSDVLKAMKVEDKPNEKL